MIKVAINGFGRIGRTAFRAWLNRQDLHDQLDIVVINTSSPGLQNLRQNDEATRLMASVVPRVNTISFEELALINSCTVLRAFSWLLVAS